MHLILRESFERSVGGNLQIKHPISKLLDFLRGIDSLVEVCRRTSSSNLRAGEQFSEQALAVLCAASESDRYVNVVNAMLEAGTGVSCCDQDLMTPLHHAAMCGSTDVMRILFQYKSSVHCRNNREETCFLVACKYSQWEAAQLLFDKGSDPFCSDTDQCSPISVAMSSHAVGLLQHMAAQNPKVLEELQRKVSLADVVVFHYDLLTRDMQNISNEEITDIVKLACTHGNHKAIRQFSRNLSDQALAVHIEEAYSANQFDCVNELLIECKTRTHVPCPHISLSDSCKSDQLFDLTRFLTENGKDVNEDHCKPLRTAVMSNNTKAVRYLMQNGANVDNNKDKVSETLLTLACRERNLDMVDLLLQYGADINGKGDETPLTICCLKGSVKVLKRLLSNETPPDLSIPNKTGKTPVDIAKGTCFSEIVLHLIGGDPAFHHVSFNQVCQTGREDLVKSFLQNHPACQPVEEESLDFVVKTDNLSLMKIIFSNDQVIKTSSVLMHALKTACTLGSSKMVGLFIDHDSSIIKKCINEDGNSNLHLAICHQKPDLVDILINNGYDPTQENVPFEEAVKSEQVLKLLLQFKLSQANLNDALMCVCKGGQDNAKSCARLLLDANADVNYSNKSDKMTPLLAAAFKSSIILVELLLSRDADPNIADADHRTPLFVACMLENCEIASRLLDNKGKGGMADPYLPGLPLDKHPLWVSCMKGYLDIVQLLLLCSDIREQKVCDLSAQFVQAAHDAGQHEVVRLLLEFRINPTVLANLSLLEACKLGYAEHALSIHHQATPEELCKSISEACNNGFYETALSMTIDIQEEPKKRQCFYVWEQCHEKEEKPRLSQSPLIQSETKDPLWECFKHGDIDKLKNLLLEGHNPNIQDETGKTLLQVCTQRNLISAVETLCNCPSIDINQKDSVGRNVLFYCLGCPPQIIEGNNVSVFDYLVEKGAEIFPDKFQRTLLHEWCPEHQGSAQGLSVEKFTTHIQLDSQDYKGQTPLHIAVTKKKHFKVRKLLRAGSNPHVKDAKGLSPSMLAERDPYINEILREYNPDQSKTTMDYPRGSEDKQSTHLPKEYSIDQRLTHALHTLFKQRYPVTSEDMFRANFETPIQISTDPSFKQEFKLFRHSVLDFMEDLGRVIGQDDPLFEFIPTLSGSCSEATKVIEMNEADVLCRFQHPTWKDLTLRNYEKDNFTYMKLESEELARTHPHLFNKGRLSAHRLFQQFYGLVRKHIVGVLKRHSNLYIIDVHNILPQDCTICPLDLVWSGTLFLWQEFSLDVVPAIPVSTTQLPGKLKHHELVHDLVVVPKWTAGLIKEEHANEAFQLGFSFTEKDLFHAMPVALRDGYRLAKVIVHDCMPIDGIGAGDSISSYLLKCQAFEYFTTMPDFLEKMKASTARDLIDDVLQTPAEVMKCAGEIFSRFEQCMERHHLESFFLLGSNLIGHSTDKEEYRPLLHVKMCRAMLSSPKNDLIPWAQLAEAVVDQLIKPKNLKPSVVCARNRDAVGNGV